MTNNGVDVIADGVATALSELIEAGNLRSGQIIVIGTSTSEVAGGRIGTSGSADIAASIFAGVSRVREKTGFVPAFQCCEHLNRALVVERSLLDRLPQLEPVSVVPVAKAGGSMAAHAYRHLQQAVVVETIRADAGIDIGATLIGMHLKPVAVPVRPSIRMIGQAPVTMAYSRPKLIGGVRAVYALEDAPSGPIGTEASGTCD
jgi:uncharacterized protein (TIGR01440 family)